MYKILRDFTGSPDRKRPILYKKGQAFDICEDFSEELAAATLARGWVKEIKLKKKAIKRVKL